MERSSNQTENTPHIGPTNPYKNYMKQATDLNFSTATAVSTTTSLHTSYQPPLKSKSFKENQNDA
jgi:hypothetical protein